MKNNILEINLFNPKVLNKFTTFLHRHIKEEFEPKKTLKIEMPLCRSKNTWQNKTINPESQTAKQEERRGGGILTI